ncbi:MAG TPA: hypothetical protein VMS21_05530 [Methylomirabilota bacterium]|nr:hypothetical protein [Methylomirabilota bacterium]
MQPKKETVRITLPPKPSASPTIKLPTLPAGGAPAQAASGAAKPAPAPATPGSKVAPPPARPGGATLQRQTAAPASGVGSAAPRRPMTPVQPAVSAADRGLAIGAAVASLLALASALFLLRFQ